VGGLPSPSIQKNRASAKYRSRKLFPSSLCLCLLHLNTRSNSCFLRLFRIGLSYKSTAPGTACVIKEALCPYYWFSEDKGEVYCLFEAPNAEAAEALHREAHGNVADEIVEVKKVS
jgi:hypothetical protein